MTSSPDCIRAESGEEEGDGSERDTVRAEFERRALTMMRDGRNGLGYRHLPVVSGADGTTPTALLCVRLTDCLTACLPNWRADYASPDVPAAPRTDRCNIQPHTYACAAQATCARTTRFGLAEEGVAGRL